MTLNDYAKLFLPSMSIGDVVYVESFDVDGECILSAICNITSIDSTTVRKDSDPVYYVYSDILVSSKEHKKGQQCLLILGAESFDQDYFIPLSGITMSDF